MSFPRYPKYKASGVEWLGDVPEGWEVIQLRRIVAEHRQGYYSTDPYVEIGVKLLRITDLGESGAVNYDTCPRVEDRSDVREFLLRNGDFVFARTGGAGSFGLIGEISERIAYASYLIRFRFCETSLPGFLRFFFLSAGFKGGIQRDIHGGVNQNVHAQDIKNQCFAIPPLPEQTAIAEFLDRETAKIDELVAEQRRLIELLKEKRQAVISHAVTKGLNPDALMKPSGIEWLGDVPAHWEIKQLRYVCYCLDGRRVPLNSAQRAEKQGEVPYWGANSIVDYVDEALFDEDLVLLGEDGAPFFDKSKPVGFFSEGKVWPNNHVHVLRPMFAHTGRFIVHALNITDFAHFIDGSTRDKLTQGAMKVIPLPFPRHHEQTAIVEFLESELAKFDTLTAEAQRAIDLLKERRTALISAAVTGQIDVRNQHPA